MTRMESLKFTDDFQIDRDTTTQYTVLCRDHGELTVTTDYETAKHKLSGHAFEAHSTVLPQKPKDFKGNLIG